MRFKMARFDSRAFFLFAFVFSLFACSSGDTEEFRTAVFVNDLDIVSIGIDVDDDQEILDLNDENAQLTLPVIAMLADGSSVPVSRFLQWSSSDSGVISVNGSGVARPVATGFATITVTLGDFSDSIELEASDAELVSIATSFTGTVLVCSFDTELSAAGTYEDASVRNITDRVTWSSDAESVAVVQENTSGRPTILARSAGTAELTDSLGAISSIVPLEVTIAPGTLSSIAVTPATVSNLERGRAQNFVATGTYTDTSTRDITRASVWSSSNDAVLAPVTATPGRFTALLAGSANATVACGGLTRSSAVTVIEPREIDGLEIRDPSNIVRNLIEKDPLDADFQLRAFLKFSDGSYEEVTEDEGTDWSIKSSSVSGVLTVGNDEDLDNKGEVELLNREGNVVIEVRARGEADEITIDVDFKY